MNARLARLAQTDWSGANEQTLREELIFPILDELGYGQATLNPIRREVSCRLQDPYLFEGRERVRVDYLPTVLGRELWVMEAKGSDDTHPERTLRQARSYAVHPEIRAPLLAVFDAEAVRVLDPWGMEWETPIVDVPIHELDARFDEIHAALSPDGVARLVRRQQAQHVERALSASLDLTQVGAARTEFDELFARAEQAVQENRQRLEAEVREEVEAGWEQVVRSTGVWAVAQHNNTVWVGVGKDGQDLIAAVRARPREAREAEMDSAEGALAAQTQMFARDAAPAARPLWFWRFLRVAAGLQLRGLPGCEARAGEWVRQGLRDALLDFPDDAASREAHRVELAFAPLVARFSYMPEIVDFDAIAAKINEDRSPEDQIRIPMGADLFRRILVDNSVRRILATTPWGENDFRELADAAEAMLTAFPRPPAAPQPTMWHDPLFEDWAAVEPFCDCTLVTLAQGGAEDVLCGDPDLLDGLKELSARTETRTGRGAQTVLDRLEQTGPKATPPSWWLTIDDQGPDGAETVDNA